MGREGHLSLSHPAGPATLESMPVPPKQLKLTAGKSVDHDARLTRTNHLRGPE